MGDTRDFARRTPEIQSSSSTIRIGVELWVMVSLVVSLVLPVLTVLVVVFVLFLLLPVWASILPPVFALLLVTP